MNKRYLYRLVFLLLFFLPGMVSAQSPVPAEEQYYRGEIIQIIKEEMRDDPYQPLFRQELLVQFNDGSNTISTVVPYEVDTDQSEKMYRAGDKVVLTTTDDADGAVSYYITDTYRLRAFFLILGVFILMVVWFARMQGLRALVGLAISFAIIMYFVLPFIIDGFHPLLIALSGAIGITCIAIYTAHGFHARTTIAFLSTFLTLLASAGIAHIFVRLAALSGVGTEEAFYVRLAPVGEIDLRGLLLAGILIGVLGVLDDITTAQAAAVEQIQAANSKMTRKELYERASIVGREHITSLVNTLILAYAGVSLPLMLLFTIYERPLWVTVNSEVVMEEIIRMLVGSMALILAVPLTTYISSWYFSKKHA